MPTSRMRQLVHIGLYKLPKLEVARQLAIINLHMTVSSKQKVVIWIGWLTCIGHRCMFYAQHISQSAIHTFWMMNAWSSVLFNAMHSLKYHIILVLQGEWYQQLSNSNIQTYTIYGDNEINSVCNLWNLLREIFSEWSGSTNSDAIVYCYCYMAINRLFKVRYGIHCAHAP